LDISFNESRDIVATLSGESDGYRSIALQSQALAKNTSLKNIIFSNFVVNPRGRVSFNVSFIIPRSDILFTQYILDTLESNPPPTISQETNPETILETTLEAEFIQEAPTEEITESIIDGVAS